MKIKTVKKVIKEFMIKGRNTPLRKKVRIDHIIFFALNQDHTNSRYTIGRRRPQGPRKPAE